MLSLCFNESVVQGICWSYFFVFPVPMLSHPVLLVFLLTVLIVFPALAGLVTLAFLLYYKSSSFPELPYSPVVHRPVDNAS